MVGMQRCKLPQKRDFIKKQQCDEHGIRVVYYSDLGTEYPYYFIEDFTTLLKAIKSKGIIKDTSTWDDPQLPFDFD